MVAFLAMGGVNAVEINRQPAYATDLVSKFTGASTNLVGACNDFYFEFRWWGATPEAFDIDCDDIVLEVKRIAPLPEKT
jgi:hypothetical protein